MAKGAYVGVPTPSGSIGDLAVGSTIKLNVSGTATDFIVVHQGNPDASKYDASCNGTWLLMKPCYPKRAWDSANNDYGNSDISTYLNGDFFSLLDSHVRNAIKQVKIPYYNGSSVQSGANGFSTKVFLLSGLEVGNTTALDSTMSADGAKLDYFETGESTTSAKNLRIAYPHTGGSATNWWLRSGVTSSSTFCCYVNYQGLVGTNFAVTSTDMLVRPAFILPSNLALVNGTIDGTEASTKDVARKIKKPYIGVGGVARKVKKIYIGVNGVAKLCWASANPVFADNTWAEIIAACQANSVPDEWAVGDSKTMTINGKGYQIDIIGKNHDDYADGSGKAPLTLQMHDCYATTYQMHFTVWGDVGWSGCDMRTTHLPSLLAKMPAEVQAGIREVNKLTERKGTSSTIATTVDKLFLLSEYEVFGRNGFSYAGEGKQYAYYSSGNSKIKYLNGSQTNWWERSPVDQGDYCYSGKNGAARTSATDSCGVAFAFCF